MIAGALSNTEDKSIYNTGCTAKAWFARRIKNQRIKNREVRLAYIIVADKSSSNIFTGTSNLAC